MTHLWLMRCKQKSLVWDCLKNLSKGQTTGFCFLLPFTFVILLILLPRPWMCLHNHNHHLTTMKIEALSSG